MIWRDSDKRQNEGGYYQDDRPPDIDELDLSKIPNAVPRQEAPSRYGNNPYKALGKSYKPLSSSKGFVERGQASWYGVKYHGNRTSSGEIYDMFQMTAAHPVLPLPTYVKVTNLENHKSIVVRVNDRGPFLRGRIIDLSYVAAAKLDIIQTGTGNVEVRAIDPLYTQSTGQEIVETNNQKIVDTANRYFLQIGAFREYGNALMLVEKLNRGGFQNAYISSNDNQTDHLFKVRVGLFKSSQEAIKMKEQVEGLLGNTISLMKN